MRNYLFALTVLAVTIWTSRSDQTGFVGDRQTDFYLEDMEGGDMEGSGSDYNSYSSIGNGESSYFSMGNSPGSDSVDDVVSSGDSSDDDQITSSVFGSMHLNKVYIDAYNDPDSLEYKRLEMEFTLAMDEMLNSSPLGNNYISTRVVGFSPGSVKVDFVVKMEETNRMEEALTKVIENGIETGSLSHLEPQPETLVVRASDTDTGITFTTTPSAGKETTSPMQDTGKNDVYRPTDPKDETEVDVVEKNIIDMILGDPIIIAAIVGGIIVILLSIILLFLFVVYRLKKKDEGSYSLDEPAKAKDPTAYWKETKEFYA